VKPPIYMDYHSTTPVDQRVLDRMLPFFAESFGNAASRSHSFGWQAEEAVEAARVQVAKLAGGTVREIVFTSGATESNNLAIFGVAEAYAGKGNHVITQATEHKAVLDVCQVLQRKGTQVTILPVDAHGCVDPDALREAISEKTVLVSIMHANNEVGTLQPISEIGAICRERGVLFHCDAAQSVGKVRFDVEAMHVDLASLSAHKMYGPKGVGALFVRRKNPRVKLAPLIYGGGHERGLWSGTLNVPAVVGLGEAARVAMAEQAREAARVESLRDQLYEEICARVSGVRLNGHPTERLPGSLNLSFADLEGEALLLAMRNVAVSSGSACTSATLEPSHVLAAMGVPPSLAHSSIRFGLGRYTTAEEVAYAAAQVAEATARLRAAGIA
jgi:cysteine desulfurase